MTDSHPVATSASQPAQPAGRVHLFAREISRGLFLAAGIGLTAGLFYISYPKISLSFAASTLPKRCNAVKAFDRIAKRLCGQDVKLPKPKKI